MIAWNSKGDLLDYKNFTGGVTTTLTTTGDISDNKMTIAIIENSPSNGHDNYTVGIFTELKVGQTFNKQFISFPPIDATQRFRLTIPPTGQYRFLQVSDKNGYIPCWFGGGADAFDGDCVTPQNGDYTVAYRTDNGVGYKMLSNIKANDLVSLTENDFIPYDHQITYTYPAGYASIILTGYQTDSPLKSPGIGLDFYFPSVMTTTLKTGYYGSSFNRFHTNFSLGGTSNVYIWIEKMGDLLTKIDIPDANGYSITSKDPYNATFTAPPAMLFQETQWIKTNFDDAGKVDSYVTWNVTSPSTHFKIGKLPDEILSAHPNLKVDAGAFTTLKFFIGPQTYDEYIGTRLNGNWWDNFEQTTIQVY